MTRLDTATWAVHRTIARVARRLLTAYDRAVCARSNHIGGTDD